MNQKSEEDGWWDFCKICQKATTTKELSDLFELFLTPSEIDEIAGRYRIVRELVKGKLTQREIASQHGVTISKITRGSNSLKRIPLSLRSFIEKHI